MNILNLNTIGYVEDNGWEIVALEMDIVANGANYQEAFDNLKDLVLNQINFALHKNDPEMLFKSAPKEYWDLHAKNKADKRTICHE